MLTVTPEFKQALRSSVKRVSGYFVLQDGTEYLPGEDLRDYTIESVGGFLRTAMSKATITLKHEHELAGEIADVHYGVEYDGDFHYVQVGKYEIIDATYKKDTELTTLTGYDNMHRFEQPYTSVGTFPTTLYDYLQAICSLAGVVLENAEIYNGDLSIPEDYYQTMSEYTIRDVLEDICEASASYALINPDGNLELRQVADTGETLTYSDLIEYELGDYWGGINSLVLSRQPQNDDVYTRNDDDINAPTTRNVLDLNKFDVGYKVEDI